MGDDKIVSPTSKGQITIPKEIREAFKIDEKTKLRIYINGEDIVLKPISIIDELEDLILQDISKEGLSSEEIKIKLAQTKEKLELVFEKLIQERKLEGSVSLEDFEKELSDDV